MLAPAPRPRTSLPVTHPCFGCEVRNDAVCGVLECGELAELRRQGTTFRLGRGQPLFHEGEPASRVFTLTRGTLKLYKLLPDGRRQVTGYMHPGGFLGVSVEDDYAFTAEALEPAQLCAFPRARFDDFTEDHAEMERELYWVAARELSAAQQQMVLLGRKTAVERLASFFVILARRADRAGAAQARYVDLPMSRSDIADHLGLTKETVSRVLAQLKNQRLIRLEALDRIEILDRGRLELAADGGSENRPRRDHSRPSER